jgi:hypothetical protein
MVKEKDGAVPMNWTELLAAGTVAYFAWQYFATNGGPTTIRSEYARPIDDPKVIAKIQKIQAAGPYRDYTNVVELMESGQWYGGL